MGRMIFWLKQSLPLLRIGEWAYSFKSMWPFREPATSSGSSLHRH